MLQFSKRKKHNFESSSQYLLQLKDDHEGRPVRRSLFLASGSWMILVDQSCLWSMSESKDKIWPMCTGQDYGYFYENGLPTPACGSVSLPIDRCYRWLALTDSYFTGRVQALKYNSLQYDLLEILSCPNFCLRGSWFLPSVLFGKGSMTNEWTDKAIV